MPRPRLHDDALRERLLEVASRMISSGGERSVTVRGVAVESDTSASAVYALFGSREAMVAAVTEEGFRRFGARLGSVPCTDDPRADLAALGFAYRDSALADPHFYRVMFDRVEKPRPTLEQPTFLALRDAVARVLVAAQPPAARARADAGHPAADDHDGDGADVTARPDDGRADEAALALWALAHGLVSLELAGLVPGDDRTRADRYRAILLAAGPSILTLNR